MIDLLACPAFVNHLSESLLYHPGLRDYNIHGDVVSAWKKLELVGDVAQVPQSHQCAGTWVGTGS